MLARPPASVQSSWHVSPNTQCCPSYRGDSRRSAPSFPWSLGGKGRFQGQSFCLTSASISVPVCVPVCEGQKLQVTETPGCPLFLSKETELGFPPLPSPAVDLGTHFASLNLGLLICEVWGWVAPHSSVFPFEVFACAVTSSFAPTASPIRSLLTRAFRCWHNLRASLGWHMSGFPAWERGKTTDTQGRSRCSASGPLRGEKQPLWVEGAPRGWSLADHGEDWPLSAPELPGAPVQCATCIRASKASTSSGSDHCRHKVQSSSQNRPVPLIGQETQLLPKNISGR